MNWSVRGLLCGSVSALVTVASACEPGQDRLAGFETVDSAGVTIVTSHSPRLVGDAAWTIDPEPLLEIGTIDGAEPYVFTRIWDATTLPDGRIAVADELALEIRLFDADGQHLNSIGGPGDGPREFQGPPFLAVSGGTLRTWDGGHLRLSRFEPDGTLVEQTNMQQPLASLGVRGFRNGKVWEIDALGTLLSTGPERPRPTEGLRDSFRRITVFEEGDTTGYDFGAFLAGQSSVVRLERMSIGIGNPYAPFHAAGLTGDGRLAIGDGLEWEVRVRDFEGTLVQILRAAVPRVPVTDELSRQALENARDMAERSPLNVTQAEEAFSLITLPDSVPAIAAIRDSGGDLWVGRRTGSWWEVGDYDVFDDNGRWVTTVVMPPEIEEVHEIGTDYILAHVTDELDVAYLRMYRILRPAG